MCVFLCVCETWDNATHTQPVWTGVQKMGGRGNRMNLQEGTN